MVAEFDLAVIGAGAGGLVASGFAASLGLKVALISDGPAGGECLWTGCVPSKSLIHSAYLAHEVRYASKHGFMEAGTELNFKTAMASMKRARERVGHHDSREAIEALGVKLIDGKARFTSATTLEIDGESLEARKCVIATGASQRIPQITGLSASGCLTHESILDLEDLPQHLLILGGGPVSVEYGQCFLRFGSKVTIVQRSDRLLPREEPDTSAFLLKTLQNEGATVHLNAEARNVLVQGNRKVVTVAGAVSEEPVFCDALLVATGKTANIEYLNLAAAGIQLERGFIKVDKHQRTSAANIWACGDVSGSYQFTHYADHQARVAVMNACLGLPVTSEKRVVPWCTFTDPEIAHVGMKESEAAEKFGQDHIVVLKYELKDFDRAIIDDAATGFIKVIIDKSGEILGASVIAKRAGELIHEFALAMKTNTTIEQLSGYIHVYPTMSDAIRPLGYQYYETALKGSWKSKALKWWANLLR